MMRKILIIGIALIYANFLVAADSIEKSKMMTGNTNTHSMKVFFSGGESMSLDQQLKGVSVPANAMPEKPVAVAKVAPVSYPVAVGNEQQIAQLQVELQNAFNNADKDAKDFSKPEQFVLYLLYKQAQQNQMMLEQNNDMILELRKISAQNDKLLQLLLAKG